MVLADFAIEVESDPPREIRVIVYDSLKGLRIASTRYVNRTKSPRKNERNLFANTLGLCHCFEWQDHNGVVQPQCAIVRLAHPNLGAGIVTHELTHAAVWIHELDTESKPITNGNDEPFAWLLGELVRQTVNAMYDRGVYDVED